MLYADKAALENRTKVKLLAIRERELTLYTNNCRTVGTVSALMAGIAYSALVRTQRTECSSLDVIDNPVTQRCSLRDRCAVRIFSSADLHQDGLLSGKPNPAAVFLHYFSRDVHVFRAS